MGGPPVNEAASDRATVQVWGPRTGKGPARSLADDFSRNVSDTTGSETKR